MYVNSNRATYVGNRTLFLKPTLMEHVMEDLNAAGCGQESCLYRCVLGLFVHVIFASVVLIAS
jgi:hypothetical protein